MTHEQAIEGVKNIAIYTAEFLARKHGVAFEQVIAALIAGDAAIVRQWDELFALASETV